MWDIVIGSGYAVILGSMTAERRCPLDGPMALSGDAPDRRNGFVHAANKTSGRNVVIGMPRFRTFSAHKSGNLKVAAIISETPIPLSCVWTFEASPAYRSKRTLHYTVRRSVLDRVFSDLQHQQIIRIRMEAV